ncbi:MAG: UDP-3-O-(3-hydroxymyristoyl)glucosamine N-acyltransferase [Gemmatimonas sp.]
MADPRFFARQGPFPIGELARLAGAEIAPGGDVARLVKDVASLDTAGPDDISFLDNPRYAASFAASAAGACIVHPRFVSRAPAGMVLLTTPAPYMAYAKVSRAFYPPARPQPGIASNVVIDPTATVGEGCRIDPGAVIGAGAEIGAGTWVAANAVIGDSVRIGRECSIGACASITHALIGDRVMIYAGARIGQDGFGFASDRSGHLRVPQLGRVVIGDDVEVGANTTIDRGAGPDTVIGPGCMIDNLVQIGHNVQMGRGCVIVSQVGISGSTRLGDFVVIGGQAGLAGHLSIGSGVRIAAKSGVNGDVPAGTDVGGAPAVPVREWRRQIAAVKRLGRRDKAEGEPSPEGS